MRITVCGAAGGEVTGSSYLVETSRARVLVDCGMFQGRGAGDERNRGTGPVHAAELDAAVLTHAHLDHCGRFGLLAKGGLKCPITATPATVDFARLVLEDAGRIHANDTERENKYRLQEGRPLLQPMYTIEDLRKLEPLVRPLKYGEQREIASGISIRFVDAGHILGSASVEMIVRDGDASRTIVFSGDIGRWESPFLQNPTPLPNADLVFLESTYGDRDHRSTMETVKEFKQIIHDAIWAKEKVLIPAFAIGRTQLVLYYLAELIRAGAVPEFPIYLDSPMAITATELYIKHQDLFDEESSALATAKQFSKDLKNLRFIHTPDESRALNDRHEPCIIIAGSGMCDSGRIVHHLRHNLWRRGVAVVIVGFAAEGSLGHALITGAKEVQIHRRMIPVRANIHTLGGFSAHAGQSELLRWFEPLAASRPRVLLTHGENPQRRALAAKLKERWGIEAGLPELDEVVEVA